MDRFETSLPRRASRDAFTSPYGGSKLRALEDALTELAYVIASSPRIDSSVRKDVLEIIEARRKHDAAMIENRVEESAWWRNVPSIKNKR